MSATAGEREFDVVVLGATGFTGRLTAEQVAAHLPAGARWAIAGRNEEKLAQVRDSLAAGAAPELVVVDTTVPSQVDALAARTRVLATTVGPYLQHGAAVVGACARAGTDYVDLTGEPEFVDQTWLAYHQIAQDTGARLVHACGFDSIPHDLGVQFLVEQLPSDLPIRARGVVRAGAQMSGGTFHSALNAFASQASAKRTAAARRAAETRDPNRKARAVAGRPHRDSLLDYWLLPLPTIDPQVVVRSARALPDYGPDFSYSHWAGCRTLRMAVGGAVGVTGLVAAAQVPFLRSKLGERLQPGAGPSPERRAKSWFTVDLVGNTPGAEPVHVRVSGGDPGYTETSKMLAQSALCLAFDELPATSGQVTTATAMGPVLRRRLQEQGMRFEVLTG